MAIAGAVAPLATVALAGIDARLPIALGAAALAVAAVFVLRVEPSTRQPEIQPPLDLGTAQGGEPASGPALASGSRSAVPYTGRRALLLLVAAVLIGAIGMQLHTGLLSAPLYARLNAGAASPWLPTFWVGFALGLGVVAIVGAGRRRLRSAALTMVVGTALVAIAQSSSSLPLLVGAQFCTGIAWAVFCAFALDLVLSKGGGRGAATPAGWLMSAFALAACARVLLVTSGQQSVAVLDEAVLAAWALGALLVVLLAMGRRAAFDRV